MRQSSAYLHLALHAESWYVTLTAVAIVYMSQPTVAGAMLTVELERGT